MRLILLLPLMLAVPAAAQDNAKPVIRMIDATTLSMADLMALAAAERDNPTPLSCCDWGAGCAPHGVQNQPDS